MKFEENSQKFPWKFTSEDSGRYKLASSSLALSLLNCRLSLFSNFLEARLLLLSLCCSEFRREVRVRRSLVWSGFYNGSGGYLQRDILEIKYDRTFSSGCFSLIVRYFYFVKFFMSYKREKFRFKCKKTIAYLVVKSSIKTSKFYFEFLERKIHPLKAFLRNAPHQLSQITSPTQYLSQRVFFQILQASVYGLFVLYETRFYIITEEYLGALRWSGLTFEI